MACKVIVFCAEYFGCVPVKWLNLLADERMAHVMMGAVGSERAKALFPEIYKNEAESEGVGTEGQESGESGATGTQAGKNGVLGDV